MTTEKSNSFYGTLLRLALPMMIQNIISFAVQMLDSIMVGLLGDRAVSAVTLANQPYFIFTTIVYGLASGGSVLISQLWGQNEKKKIKKVMTLIIVLSAAISLIFGAACYFGSETILGLFAKDSAVIKAGSEYLRIIVISYLFNALANGYLCSLKATENVSISTKVFCSSFAVNLAANYVLIFGKFGLPAMGIKGAAIGTIIARVYECIICLIYGKYYERNIGYSLLEKTPLSTELLQTFLHISIPVILHDLIWSLAASTQMAIIGNMDSMYVTAASIASTAQQIGMLFLYGLCGAASIMIGKEIGKGNKDEINHIEKKLVTFSLITGIAGCLLIFVMRDAFLFMYPNISAESAQLARQMISILSVATILISAEYIYTIGILRGAGDTVFAFLTDCICIWLIGIPLGMIGANVLHYPVLIVYALFRIDSIFKIILCAFRVRSGKYIKELV